MIHLGDITKIRGDEIPPVDCITGGSPCQDLSVAGKRAGLEGERSGLFMEQVRIVKEMRERDRRAGRTAWAVRPRFMVWENVPGAFSSNKGRDFQAVLSEIVKIVEPDAPDVPLPDKGKWPKAGCLYSDVGDWSVAWRVHDAQFWGVPQRRKRIALVADFGGLAAPEVLFERAGVSGDSEPCGEAWEGAAAATGSGVEGASGVVTKGNGEAFLTPEKHTSLSVGGGQAGQGYPAVLTGGAISFQERAGKPGGDKGILIQPERTGSLSTLNNQSVYCLQGNGIDRADTARCNGRGWREDQPYTLNTVDRPAVYIPNVANTLSARHDGSPQPDKGNGANIVCAGFKSGQGYQARSIGYQEEMAPTLPSEAGGNSVPAVYDARGNGEPLCVEMTSTKNTIVGNGVSPTDGMAVLCFQNTGQGWWNESEVGATIRTPCGGDSVKANLISNATSTVRRLTPMECERLQGYPDGWTDIGEWTDSNGKKHKAADSPRYKALGNSIALPFWFWLLRRISAQYERPATLGSLFDGIGGFPLCWERCNGKSTAVWASEIEEFPIAVAKKHFPEEKEDT